LAAKPAEESMLTAPSSKKVLRHRPLGPTLISTPLFKIGKFVADR
jgi:hypothetical protein